MAWACRACRKGDCADCINWVQRAATCSHVCPADPHQLALPWVTEDPPAAAAVRIHPPATHSGGAHQDQEA